MWSFRWQKRGETDFDADFTETGNGVIDGISIVKADQIIRTRTNPWT